MKSSQERLDLLVDVFELKGQSARVLPSVKPPQLVEAILQEFRELEYLSSEPSVYYLVRADDRTPLDEAVEMGQQKLGKNACVLLQQREQPIPKDAQRLPRRVYLREQSMGRVYRVPWQPAIIGRLTESQPHGERVVVDLQYYPTGLRVSRRHLAVTEADGQLYIENLAENPASILRDKETTIPIDKDKVPLLPGDLVRLERSQISLKLIVLDDHDEESPDSQDEETTASPSTETAASTPNQV